MEIRDGCEEVWTTESPSHRFTVRDVDIRNAVLLEEFEDLLGRMECLFAAKSFRQDSYPNRNGSGNDCLIRCNLMLNVVDVLIVLDVFVDFLLLNPAETSQVNRRMPDGLRVEEFNDLEIRRQLCVFVLLVKSKFTYLGTNRSP